MSHARTTSDNDVEAGNSTAEKNSMSTAAKDHSAKRAGMRIAAVGTTLATVLVPLSLTAAPANAATGEWVPSSTIASDTMTRTVATGWGSAPTGGAYTTQAGSTYSVGNGVGTMKLTKGGASAAAQLPSAKGVDTLSRIDISPTTLASAGSGFYTGVRTRSAGAANYLTQARITATGSVRLSIVRVNADSTTATLATEVDSRVVLAAGAWATLETRVTGTTSVTIEARVYARGAAAPAWQAVTVDSSAARLAATGSTSLWAYTSGTSGAAALNFDNFTASAIAPQNITPPPAAQGAGSAAIGSAGYTLPTAGLYVSPSGDDTAAGTVTAPLKTVTKAVNKAVSGTTIVVRGGTYHEKVIIPTGKKLTIQSYPKEAVWFDGSTSVTDFTKSGSTWVKAGWTTKFDSSPTYVRGAPDSDVPFWGWINPDYPMAAHPDQVWIDNVALKQVGSVAEVVAGTFYVDYAASKLYIGSDPTGKAVRASDLVQAMQIVGQGSTVRGVGFRRFAPSVPDMGAVTVNHKDVTLENVVISDMATTGLSVMSTNATLRDITVLRSGMLGVHANYADGLKIIRADVQNSNLERFNTAPVAGGIKITRSRGIDVTNSRIANNLGIALWFDESVYDMDIIGNDVLDNYWFGIVLELSAKAVIANNVTARNGNDGIRLVNTSDVKIWNNTSVKNLRDINITQDERVASDKSAAGHDPRQPFPDPTMTWIVNNVQVKNNVLSDSNGKGDALFGLQDKTKQRTGAQMGVTLDSNLYNRTTATAPTATAIWSTGAAGWSAYSKLDAFVAATNQDAHSRAVDGSTAVTSTFALNPNSPTVTDKQSIPADVAAAVGVSSGAKYTGAWR